MKGAEMQAFGPDGGGKCDLFPLGRRDSIFDGRRHIVLARPYAIR